MNAHSLHALWSVAYKEFLHIARDWRILILLISFPPVFTLMIGHAFEVGSLTDVPTILRDEDQSEESKQLVEHLSTKEAFRWKHEAPQSGGLPDLRHAGVQGIVVIPRGWGAALVKGPLPLEITLDGSDTTTAPALGGMLEQALGEFQLKAREALVDNLPDEVIEMGKKIPEDFRNRMVSQMEPWTVKSTIVYNPDLRFVVFVAPGLIGLILQLLTVPLMAVTITREREGGTLSQLLLTSLRHWEIVVGKVLPYLLLSSVLVGVVMLITRYHFDVAFPRLPILAGLCFLMLLCSLGMGLVISAFCNTQAQAIQFAVFFLVPIIPLCGAFAPLEQLPPIIRGIAEIFPLTHFCRAFRAINLANAEASMIIGDVAFLGLGALATFAAAALLLRRTQS